MCNDLICASVTLVSTLSNVLWYWGEGVRGGSKRGYKAEGHDAGHGVASRGIRIRTPGTFHVSVKLLVCCGYVLVLS